MKLRVKTKREVWAFTALLTVTTVMIPLTIVWFTLASSAEPFSNAQVSSLMTIAGLIPLMITPPIAYVVMDLIRVQGEMIARVDARIMFDMLTGVFNRNHFLDGVRAGQASGPIMIVDADHFKAINDTYGHAVGDETLRVMANAVRQCVGEDGIVGRLGGEEFAVFLPGKSEKEGHDCAEAICTAIRGLSPLVAGSKVSLSVSIGCVYHRATKVIGHSLKEADDLLYRAKAEGRDRAVYETGKAKLARSA